MNFYIRRKSDNKVVAMRKDSRQQAEDLVKYLNWVDEANEYYYSQS